MDSSFVLRASERGYNHFLSTGDASSYVGGHPDATITRHSSFNFGPYQAGRAGFGRLRVFGDEVFSGSGCGYNIHRHHNFIICAFVLEGQLTHVNTVGNIDQLTRGDFYAFSAGSGGKHCELNLPGDDANILYLWILPNQLLLPPTYERGRYDEITSRNRIVPLLGNADGALRISQDAKVSRLATDVAGTFEYIPHSALNGVYVFVIDGNIACNDTPFARRDSCGLWGQQRIVLAAGEEPADVLIFESAP